MAVPSPTDLTIEKVKHFIDYGQMFPKIHDAPGRVGVHYRVLRDVIDENGTLIKGFYYCSICGDVIYHVAANGTTPLMRHVNACEGNKLFSI